MIFKFFLCTLYFIEQCFICRLQIPLCRDCCDFGIGLAWFHPYSARSHPRLSRSHHLFFIYIFWRARVCWPLLCCCRPFFRDVWIRTQRAAIESRRAANFPTHPHLSCIFYFYFFKTCFKKDIDTYTRNLVGSVLLAVTTFGTVLLLALRPIPHSLEKTVSVSLEDKTGAVGTGCGTKMYRWK